MENCPTLKYTEWMDKEDVLYTQKKIEYYSTTKKRREASICNINGPGGYYAQWNNSDRERV